MFLAATCAIRPCDGTSVDPWYGKAISMIGVATTVSFVFVSPWIVWRASKKLRRAAALITAGAFIVNSPWYVFTYPTSLISELDISSGVPRLPLLRYTSGSQEQAAELILHRSNPHCVQRNCR